MTKRILLSILMLVIYMALAGAVPQYIPVVSGQFSTGQWYFEGDKSSLGGNAGITFVPAVRYTNKFSVIPTIDSNYRGTRSAEELAGGSTLFQDTWENGIGIKAIHALGNNFKIKERFGARNKWYRETTNENWNDGLYDYRTATLGVEGEYQWRKNLGTSLSYDLSYLQFPNYESLEASSPNSLAREFAGKHPLDTFINLVTLKGYAPLGWSLRGDAQVYYSPRFYKDQTVVDLSGLLSSTERKDDFTGGAMGLTRPFRTSDTTSLAVGINYGYSQLDSNQNHYDARATQFIGNYYDYDQHKIGGNLSFAFGHTKAGPMVIDSGYTYSTRDYNSRLIQAADGTYLGEKLNITETVFTAGFSYPLSKNFRMQVTSSAGRSKSNNKYEQVYRYNYDNANYQFGFTYDY